MKGNGKSFIALLIYVDDIIVARSDKNIIDELKNKMNYEFKIKDLGNLKYFLGVEVAKSRRGVHLC